MSLNMITDSTNPLKAHSLPPKGMAMTLLIKLTQAMLARNETAEHIKQ